MTENKLTFIDLFSGIGGFRRGLELAGHKCIGFCEWDKYATASYTSMHLITDEQREYLSTLDKRKRQKEILNEQYRNGEWYSNDIRTVSGGGGYQKRIAGVSERLARAFQWPDSEKDLTENQDSFKKYFESLGKLKKKIDLNGLSMKMLRECFQATKDLTTLPFSLQWMNWVRCRMAAI